MNFNKKPQTQKFEKPNLTHSPSNIKPDGVVKNKFTGQANTVYTKRNGMNTATNSTFFNQIPNCLWTVEEVASYLKLSEGHIKNLVTQRKIPFRRKRHILRFVPQEIYHWLNEGDL